MSSIISSSLQKANILVRRAIGKKTIIFIAVVNLGVLFHHFVRPEIRARKHRAWSSDADYIYEMEKANSQPK